METKDAVTALAALAQSSRLAVFRTLVQAGPAGLPAGRVAELTGIVPSSLSFHLKELSHAGLADARQDGRFVIYTARYETMNGLLTYLTDNCCGGNPCTPATACVPKAASKKSSPRKEPA
jgi:DNA-binding transcriptional ArsR family regulator